MTKITRKEVERVSLLARLKLSDDELDQMTVQLGGILDYVELLSEVDTDEIEPMAHPLPISNVFAEDEVRPSLERDEVLSNSPKRDDECYRVPAVLGD